MLPHVLARGKGKGSGEGWGWDCCGGGDGEAPEAAAAAASTSAMAVNPVLIDWFGCVDEFDQSVPSSIDPSTTLCTHPMNKSQRGALHRCIG